MIKKIIAATFLLAVVIILPYFLSFAPSKIINNKVRAESSGSFIRLKDGYTHYEISDNQSSPPIILVHGFSEPYYVWDQNYNYLVKAGFRVIRYDLYGRGLSDRPNVKYDAKLYVRQLHELLNALHISKKIILIGVSMGGAVISEYYGQYPETVSSIVLFDPTGIPKPESMVRKILKLPIVGNYVMRVFGNKILMPSGDDFYRPNRFPDWSNRFKQQMQYKGFKQAILSTIRYFHFYRQTQNLVLIGKANTPVLLFWGKEDKVIPYRYHNFFMKLIPKATFYPIDDAGHMSNIEGSSFANPIVVKWLKAH